MAHQLRKEYIVALRDRQLDCYLRAFTVQTLGQAIRGFRDETNNPQGDIYKHPEDYELYALAVYYPEDGTIEQPDDYPQQIAIASNLIETKQ